jgi:hypothetical protein
MDDIFGVAGFGECLEPEIRAALKIDRITAAAWSHWAGVGGVAPALLNDVENIEYRRGVLHVRMNSAASRFEFDRLLRCGLMTTTIKAVPGTVRNIVVKA